MKKFNIIALIAIVASTVNAQINPYESLGIKVEVLTLSNGKYEEFFDQDSIQQIGTVLINLNRREIIGSVDAIKKPENSYIPKLQSSRFISTDPMVEDFPWITPYAYASSNPIKYIDYKGKFPIDPAILEKFPRIAAFLQKGGGLENYVTGSDRMLSTIGFYSSGFLTKGQIHSDFESTKGPEIVMVTNESLMARGFDNPSNFSGHFDYYSGSIELGEAFLSRIENILVSVEGDEKRTASILMEFTSTFINEYTHYGDFQDGLDMQIGPDGKWQNIGIEPDFKDDEGNQAAGELFPFLFGIHNYEMYKDGAHIPNRKDETMIPKAK